MGEIRGNSSNRIREGGEGGEEESERKQGQKETAS